MFVAIVPFSAFVLFTCFFLIGCEGESDISLELEIGLF